MKITLLLLLFLFACEASIGGTLNESCSPDIVVLERTVLANTTASQLPMRFNFKNQYNVHSEDCGLPNSFSLDVTIQNQSSENINIFYKVDMLSRLDGDDYVKISSRLEGIAPQEEILLNNVSSQVKSDLDDYDIFIGVRLLNSLSKN